MAQGGTFTGTSQAPPLAMGLRVKLSLMMFLEFAVWGSWGVVLAVYLDKNLHFAPEQIGWIYSTLALGSIFAPLFIGQIADRYFPSEKLMAILHLSGAALLCVMANTTGANLLFVVALLYALVYSPTLVLVNSISFSHVPDGARDFPSLRVFGTIGWIVANLLVDFALPHVGGRAASETNLPLYLAAGFSAVLGVLSFALPHTPPAGKAGDAFPALRALGLLRSPSFAVFFGVSFILTIVLAFYFSFTGIFLADSILPRIPVEQRTLSIPLGFLGLNAFVLTLGVASAMAIGQVAEMILLPLLPWFLRRLGMKWVLAVGMLSWGVRYFLFALGARGLIDPWIVVDSLALHGVCFDFFFAAGFIYVDQEAPPSIRASGQALFGFLAYGLGMWLGNVISGYVVNFYSSGSVDQPLRDWFHIWLVPSIGVLASLTVFVLFFNLRPKKTASEPGAEPDIYRAEHQARIQSGEAGVDV